MVLISVSGAYAAVRKQEVLTVGMVGATAEFVFCGKEWNNMSKTAVFRQGRSIKTAEINGNKSVIPAEVLRRSGVPLEIGVYGTSDDGVIIPTTWASTLPVKSSTDENKNPSYPDIPDSVKLKEIVDFIYPINSVYVSVSSLNPSNLFGGTWELLQNMSLTTVYMWKRIEPPSEPTVTGILKSADEYVLLDVNSLYLIPKELTATGALKSADGYVLLDINSVYLMPKGVI